jgi:tetratricopeptide (TPR) repeat protein
MGALAGLACILVALYLLSHQRDEAHLRTANDLGRTGHLEAALNEAARVHREPTAARAVLVQAYADVALGRDDDARRAFRRSLELDSGNFAVRRDLALTLRRLGAAQAAREEMARALRLNPRMQVPPGFAKETTHKR